MGLDCAGFSHRLRRSDIHSAAASTKRPARSWLASYRKTTEEEQILVATCSDGSSHTFGASVAAIYRHSSSHFDAYRHVDHQLRFCCSRVGVQLAILEQEGLTNR